MATRSVLRIAFDDYCKETGADPADVLALLAAELMLTPTDDPSHVYGPSFVKSLDEAVRHVNIMQSGTVQ